MPRDIPVTNIVIGECRIGEFLVANGGIECCGDVLATGGACPVGREHLPGENPRMNEYTYCLSTNVHMCYNELGSIERVELCTLQLGSYLGGMYRTEHFII